ncbi:F-box/WD repeat-containing protein 9-like isoform X1 [Stylophora pistillata]|uniref:F-box/WD repeat-containing protein 9 n=1 Tax=Stylophora pistillata TaxID=50429 RepID=A0A2B4RKQ6_STYPI|nr:F-box/WD repeat-containing protein 9-like isoform X1 [Stylophora pistillata]PFX16947.1 F-box/WD repeat-containing protein 9 [Stylophora pistillata]
MDVDGCNGGCHLDGTVQSGSDKVEEHQLNCFRDSLEEEGKNSLTGENMKMGCGGHCNNYCDPAISSPDATVKLIEEVNGIDASDACTTDNKQRNSLSLVTLPPELILVIFSFLDARFALSVLTGVCRLFHHLLSPESSWKTRFGKRWRQRDKREDYDYVTSWKRICVQHEDMDRFWQDPVASLDFYELKDQHFATVDAVHVMRGGGLCISGARDRSVGVWNLNALCVPDEVGYGKKSFKQALDGHRGWVWCLSSDPTGAPRVCSGSWDSKIKLWDLQGQNVEMTTISTHKAAVLCLSWEQEMLISGSYDKSISLWDLRAGNIISKLKNHSKPVLCLSVDDRFIISGSEDKTLCVYDKRAAQVYKTVKLESPVFSLCHSSTCGYNYLRVGGREGRLHLLDTTADKFEEITPSIELDSNGKISAMCHYGGAVVACSSDKSIKVLEPSRVLSVIHSFDCHSGQVASVSSRGPVLASCFSELSIGIWRPKNLRPAQRI